MIDLIQKEKRILNALFSTNERIYEWEFDSLRLDLNYLQLALLKRIYCRNEGFPEISVHLGVGEHNLKINLEAALRKLKRRQHDLQSTEPIRIDRRIVFQSCEDCGRKLKHKIGDKLCSSCLRNKIRAHLSLLQNAEHIR
jgi:hypothetical protein